ncbi:MAG: hypothetical protein NVS3B20_25640 [Polyangiales bacterium]
MLIACERADTVDTSIRAAEQLAQLAPLDTLDTLEDEGAESARLRALRALFDANRSGCDRIASMLQSGIDTDAPARTVEEGIAFCTRLFDWSVQQNEEASVALYSLGSKGLLASATQEVVDVLLRHHLLRHEADVLQIGCGIGRFEVALAGLVREAHGIDVSANMIAAAQRRCAEFPNVHIHHCDGRDLSLFPAKRFDLVYAVDTFPYLVQSGMSLVEAYVSEAQRVMRRGGHLAIFNFSYRSDTIADRADVRRLAAHYGYETVVDGSSPFSVWNGSFFLLRSLERLETA